MMPFFSSRLPLLAYLFGTVLLHAPAAIADQNSAPVILPASNAVIIGTSAKFVQDHIESWTNRNDTLTWKAKIPAPGIYNVVMVYSAIDHPSESLMEIAVGAQGVQARLENCTSWAQLCTHYFGQVKVESPGEVAVKLSVLEMRGEWLMHFHEIRLVPTNDSKFIDPPRPATHPAF